MDVEGYEPFVIQGGGRTLARVQCMAMEYSPSLLQKTGVDLRGFLTGVFQQFPNALLIEKAGPRDKTGLRVITIDEVLTHHQSDAVDLLLCR